MPRANIFGKVALSGKSGFETFLTFESDLVRTNPIRSITPQGKSVSLQCNASANSHAPTVTGKSLKVKDDEENERHTPVHRAFGRDDLDVFVKPSP